MAEALHGWHSSALVQNPLQYNSWHDALSLKRLFVQFRAGLTGVLRCSLNQGVCFVGLRDAERKRLPVPLFDPEILSATLRVPSHSEQNKKCRGCAILHVGQNM